MARGEKHQQQKPTSVQRPVPVVRFGLSYTQSSEGRGGGGGGQTERADFSELSQCYSHVNSTVCVEYMLGFFFFS